MEISDQIREAARRDPGSVITVVDDRQVMMNSGRPSVPRSAVIGHYVVDEMGNVSRFEPDTGYRMVVRP